MKHKGKKVYKVKWKNVSGTTWEPAESIPENLIKEYHVNRTQAGKKKKKKGCPQ